MICLSLPVYYHLEFSTDTSTALVTWDRSGSQCGQVKSALTAVTPFTKIGTATENCWLLLVIQEVNQLTILLQSLTDFCQVIL